MLYQIFPITALQFLVRQITALQFLVRQQHTIDSVSKHRPGWMRYSITISPERGCHYPPCIFVDLDPTWGEITPLPGAPLFRPPCFGCVNRIPPRSRLGSSASKIEDEILNTRDLLSVMHHCWPVSKSGETGYLRNAIKSTVCYAELPCSPAAEDGQTSLDLNSPLFPSSLHASGRAHSTLPRGAQACNGAGQGATCPVKGLQRRSGVVWGVKLAENMLDQQYYCQSAIIWTDQAVRHQDHMGHDPGTLPEPPGVGGSLLDVLIEAFLINQIDNIVSRTLGPVLIEAFLINQIDNIVSRTLGPVLIEAFLINQIDNIVSRTLGPVLIEAFLINQIDNIVSRTLGPVLIEAFLINQIDNIVSRTLGPVLIAPVLCTACQSYCWC
ncbi:hypothetical protein RRG08_033633 [Elysia crispata]|uniref:Uncharacterized protein n=1 Tax=Elysia crispata TaxID=231223 RepID=A0AAE1CKU8_9GAST|nr:hypothetical protein RRG08_033633 [Elysia crispata]